MQATQHRIAKGRSIIASFNSPKPKRNNTMPKGPFAVQFDNWASSTGETPAKLAQYLSISQARLKRLRTGEEEPMASEVLLFADVMQWNEHTLRKLAADQASLRRFFS